MKLIKKIYAVHFFLLVLLAVGTESCTTKTESKEPNAVQEAKSQNQEGSTIATLNAEQIKTIGLKLGGIEKKQLAAIVKANGSLYIDNKHKAMVTSMYGGVIQTIEVEIGSVVKKGQVIATINNPQFIQLQEEFLALKSKISFAEQEYARQTELNTNNAGALKNLQSVASEFSALQTKLASLSKQLGLMGIQTNKINTKNLTSILSIKSPINGIVSDVLVKIGSYADLTSPIAEIIDNSQLQIALDLFEKDISYLKQGQIIHFRLTNNPKQEYDAKIHLIANSIDKDSKTIRVFAQITSSKVGLIGGMSITAMVSLDNYTSYAVPNKAIVFENGKNYIFALSNKDIQREALAEKKEPIQDIEKVLGFEKKEVLTGVTSMGFTAISPIQDLLPNAQIVIEGAFFVNATLSNTED